jgi:hypothetical protein
MIGAERAGSQAQLLAAVNGKPLKSPVLAGYEDETVDRTATLALPPPPRRGLGIVGSSRRTLTCEEYSPRFITGAGVST